MESLSPSMRDVMQLARCKGVLRAHDLSEIGVARTALSALVERGLMQRVERGTYVLTDTAWSGEQTLIEVARRVPNGVICLLSALAFHGIGTQMPPAVWLCIESKAWAPKVKTPSLEIVRQSGRAWREGVVQHQLPLGQTSVTVPITSPAKTVADCFKFRNRVGLDLAMEALGDNFAPQAGDARRIALFRRNQSRCQRDASLHGDGSGAMKNPKNMGASVRQRLLDFSRAQHEKL